MTIRAAHLPLDAEMTRCGLLIEGLETRVSSGTREYVLITTTIMGEVTCKRCRRIVERLSRKKAHPHALTPPLTSPALRSR